MKKIAEICLILILSIYGFGCQNKQIVIEGTVMNEKKVKIANAKIVALGWYESKFDGITYQKKELLTDSQGCFELYFKDVIRIDIAAFSPGLLPQMKTIVDFQNNQIGFLLRSPDSIKFGDLPINGGKEVVLYSESMYRNNEKINETNFGIDLLTGLNSVNFDSTHIHFSRSTNKDLYEIICAGGTTLMPVYEKDICKSNPDSIPGKFKYRHVFNGKELGFWVKSGNKYFRLKIMEAFDRTVPNNGGYTKELGYKFTLTVMDSAYNISDQDKINLEKWLLDN